MKVTPMSSVPEGTADEISYEKILEWMAGREWPVTSVQVGERFGISQQAAYYRLRRLRERGEVERKKYGNTVMWRALSQNSSET
jgi:Mn-dependent DtxR family transcriptional regulator